MSDKDIQKLIELAESKIRAGVTAEEALAGFVRAGILNEQGDYTAPYKELLREAGVEA